MTDLRAGFPPTLRGGWFGGIVNRWFRFASPPANFQRPSGTPTNSWTRPGAIQPIL